MSGSCIYYIFAELSFLTSMYCTCVELRWLAVLEIQNFLVSSEHQITKFFILFLFIIHKTNMVCHNKVMQLFILIFITLSTLASSYYLLVCDGRLSIYFSDTDPIFIKWKQIVHIIMNDKLNEHTKFNMQIVKLKLLT